MQIKTNVFHHLHFIDSKMITLRRLHFFVLPNKHQTSYEVVLKYAMAESRIAGQNVVCSKVVDADF
jgi:hypothetical protein